MYCSPRITSEVSTYLLPCFEAGSFYCFSAVYSKLASPQDPRNCPVSTHLLTGTGIADICITGAGFYMGSSDLNSGPYICASGP